MFIYEKELLTEDKLTSNQNDSYPRKLAKIQHRENVFVYATETLPDEQNFVCVPYGVGFFRGSKLANSMVYRDLTESEFIILKRKVNICKDEECTDQMFLYMNKR